MRKPFLMLFILLLVMAATGQDVKQDFADGEFFLAMEEYEEALYTFSKVYNNGYQDNVNINYRIGICLLQIPDRKTEAIPYLEKAVTSISEKYTEGSLREENAPPDAHLYLGNAYRINLEFEKACEQYRLFEEYVGTEGSIQSVYADQQIISCSNAVVAMNNPVDFSIGNLGQIKKSHAEVYNMVVSHDMQTLAYMGKNPFYNGVYVCRKEGEVWSKPYGINVSIISEGNMDVVGLSADGNTMLLAVSDEFASNIYKSVYENNRWNPAESLGRPINSRYYESHASFSPDSRSIYFTSNRNESIGAMDVFRSDLQEDGTWGDPVNLGENINTQLNEETPMISPDGKRIYFSSQGHNSMGGFDIFYSELQPDGSWGKAVNLGYPLNTTDDDFTISPTGFREEGIAYVFANGESSQHPLFKFEIIDPEATPVPVPFEEPVEELAVTEEAVTEEAMTEEAVRKDAEPGPAGIKTPERYLIKPVFFAFDSYALSPAAKSNLDEIAGLMKSFQDLTLQIIGHTDAIGTFEYNKLLSIDRAIEVSRYLVSKGIDEARLRVIGKSESEHVARNRTRDNRDAPDGRKLNRRAEFKVSVTENVIVEMEEIEVPDHLKLND
jgi:outer membrane protein OmpA-like peptidoglycan-associated protein/tetratricopeptide (TPR) repeat protein